MKRFLILCLGVLGWFQGSATAPVAVDSTHRILDLDEVVVTATRTPLALKQTPVITRVISRQDILRSGLPTLEEVLNRELAGVEFHQAGYGTTMSFQGLDARYVLFLVDGERMAGETYGNIDYGKIALGNIERIEIVRGASSVLYGSNAMGAVVNVITRTPRKKVEVYGAFRYGTPFQENKDESVYNRRMDKNNLSGDLSLGLKLGALSSQTSVSWRTSDAYKLTGRADEERTYDRLDIMKINVGFVPGQGMRMDTTYRTAHDTTLRAAPDKRGLSVSGSMDLSVTQRFDYRLSEKFRFELSGAYFQKERYDFNESLLDKNPMSGMVQKPWTYERSNGYNVKALMEHSPNANHKIYLSFLRDSYERNLDSLTGHSVPKQRHTYNIPRLLWTLQAGKYNRLTTGVEFVNEQLQFDLNPHGFGNVKRMNTGAFYVQDEISTKFPLAFVIGVRADANDKYGVEFTPKASVKYNYRDFILRANYAMGYRMPTLKELYMEYEIPIPGQRQIVTGNADLNPEKNHYLSLSAEYTNAFHNASVTVYKSYFRNKIDVRTMRDAADPTTVRLVYDNISRSNYAGIEFMARFRVVRGLYTKLNYNYLYQRDESSDGSTQYIFASPHTATWQWDYGFDYKQVFTGLNFTLRYVGPKDYEDMMPIVDIEWMNMGPKKLPRKVTMLQGNYRAHHPGYVLANCAVSVNYRNAVLFTMGIDNLFDYSSKVMNFNACVTPPRNAFFKLAFSLNRD